MASWGPSGGPMDRVFAELQALRAVDASAPEGVAALRKALARKTGLLVAAAAERLADAPDQDWNPTLIAAFHTLCERPLKRDPGCKGKRAVLQALDDRGSHAHDVFLTAARLRQLEPAWGGAEDTAAGVRILGLSGLLRLHAPERAVVLGEHVVDPEDQVRAAAADAIAALEDTTGIAALRLMLVSGGPAEVHEAALTAWLKLDRDSALEALRAWLAQGGERQETAAIVLGESRLERALPLLLEAVRTASTRKARRLLWICIGTLRLPSARDALLQHLDGADGENVVEALLPYRFESDLMGRALDAAPRALHLLIRQRLDPVEGG